MQDVEQFEYMIEKSYKQLKDRVKAMGKMKGDTKLQTADTLRREIKKHRNLVVSYNSTMLMDDNVNMEQTERRRNKHKQYEEKIDNLLRNLQYSRNEGLKVDNLYKNRNEEVEADDRQEVIRQIDKNQQRGKVSLQNTLKNMYIMKSVANETNVKLQEQMEKLDEIYNKVQDTQTTMKRAQKHIAYFARAVYTDKLIMALIVIIIIAIIVIVILTALGKIPGQSIAPLK